MGRLIIRLTPFGMKVRNETPFGRLVRWATWLVMLAYVVSIPVLLVLAIWRWDSGLLAIGLAALTFVALLAILSKLGF